MKSRLTSLSSIKDSVLKARIDGETHARFRQIAENTKKKESELLRELIYIVVENKPTSWQEERIQIKTGHDVIKTQRATIRLPAFILEAAKTRSKANGMAVSRWIASLVQSNLLRMPVMTNDNLLALRECNYELAAIGRNLNQIARILNAEKTDTSRLKLELIQIVQSSISGLQREIRELVRASNNVWSVGSSY